MKLILIGLILLAAWDAGFGLLMGCCIAALVLIQMGKEDIRHSEPSGQGRIKLGVGLGFATLAASLLKLAFVLLTWLSVTKVFPDLMPSIKSLWAQIASF